MSNESDLATLAKKLGIYLPNAKPEEEVPIVRKALARRRKVLQGDRTTVGGRPRRSCAHPDSFLVQYRRTTVKGPRTYTTCRACATEYERERKRKLRERISNGNDDD